jgi:hypothetical protein
VTVGARRARTILVVGIALGVILRLAALWVAPRFGYLPDHLDGMAWATWARTQGAETIYDMQPELVPLLQVAVDPQSGQPATYFAFAPHAYNYPPFSAWVFWVKGALWHALDPDARTVPAPATLRSALEAHGLPTTLRLRTANTRLARTIDALPSFAFDLVLAFGVVELVRVLWRARPEDAAGALGFALVFASPVVVLDGALWGQSDSWIASMLVWCLAWWLRGAYVAAGAVYGLALVTKPQAILFAPVLAFALLALRYRRGGSWSQVSTGLRAVPAAVVVVAAVAAPFMLHDARSGAGAWRWFERSYLGTIGADEYAYTTLNAFNLWWLDLLARRPSEESWWRLLDSRAPSLIGLSKDATGAVLLGLAICAGAVQCARRLRWTETACVVFAFVVLLAAFLLPTRVHERYVYYCMPFVTALAVGRPAWRVIWVTMSVVATAEMLSHLFVSASAESFVVSGTAAIGAVMMLPWSYGVLLLNPRTEDESESVAAAPSS